MGDEEMKDLLGRAQAGETAAKDRIIENNLNLVRSVVHRFMNRGYEWDDLFQIGCMGLVKAVERFDLSYSVRFSTYAVPMIIGEIRRHIRDDNPIKVSRPVKELAYKVHRSQEKLTGQLGREPTIHEIAKELSLSPQDIVSALEAVQAPASLYEPAYHNDGDKTLLLDQIKYCNGREQDNSFFEKLALREVLSRLPERERLVIYLRFFADKTQMEIAGTLALSQVQISRIEKQALKSIREIWQNT